MALWQFSEASQPILQRCIEASPLDPNNKWVKKFGHLLRQKAPENENVINGNEVIISLSSSDSAADSQETVKLEKLELSEEDLQELTDGDPVGRFDFILENCVNNCNLYSVIANKLPITSIEKLCEHIFESKDEINSIFLDGFYTYFLPAFLKREQSRTSIDILLKADKFNSILFKRFLEIFIKDLELPSQVFQLYVSMLDDNSQLELLNDIMLFNISDEVFIHHLHSISLLYKNCNKTELIQNYMLSKLSSVAQQCANDKTYGRLLLNYLQAQKNFTANFTIVQKIVNLHRSPFKKPCVNAFNELKKVEDG